MPTAFIRDSKLPSAIQPGHTGINSSDPCSHHSAILTWAIQGVQIELDSHGDQPTTIDGELAGFALADELGLDSYFAEVLPDKKSAKIKQLQQQGKKVAMVGDGVNDALALAQGDVGIAIGAGADVAVETADVVLVENDPRDVTDVISLSRITNRKMKQNLAWATGYNVIAIPLGAEFGGRYTYSPRLPALEPQLLLSKSE